MAVKRLSALALALQSIHTTFHKIFEDEIGCLPQSDYFLFSLWLFHLKFRMKIAGDSIVCLQTVLALMHIDAVQRPQLSCSG